MNRIKKWVLTWWPWQARVKVPEELDVPPVYGSLVVHVYDPYKRKLYFLFSFGIASIVELDIPGLFFANPVTHIPTPESVYTAILGALLTLIVGFIALGSYQYFKDVEVADKAGGIWIMRVRKNFKVKFHTVIGEVTRLSDGETEEIRAVLNNLFDKLVKKKRDLEARTTTAATNFKEELKTQAAQTQNQGQQQTTTQLVPTVTVQEIQCRKCGRWYDTRYRHDEALCDLIQEYNDLNVARTLNWFHFPLPWTPQMPSIIYGSPAERPEEIYQNMGDELILRGWFRHMKSDDYSVAVLHEFTWTPPGETATYYTPIVVPAGDSYSFIHAVEQSMLPPVIDQHVVAKAEMNMGARIATEAVQTIRALQTALQISEQTLTQLIEHATDIPGKILELRRLWETPTPRGPQTGSRWTPKAIAGLGILAIAAAVILYLLEKAPLH